MDEDSDEELEEKDERMQSSSSSENEDNFEETEVMFRTRRAEDSSNVFDFTGPPSAVNCLAAPDINAESSQALQHNHLTLRSEKYTHFSQL